MRLREITSKITVITQILFYKTKKKLNTWNILPFFLNWIVFLFQIKKIYLLSDSLSTSILKCFTNKIPNVFSLQYMVQLTLLMPFIRGKFVGFLVI